jgi:2'-5' RNA ligase
LNDIGGFIRTFVCVSPPDEVKLEITEYISLLKRSGHSYRWAAAEQMHITLRFLGEAEPSQVQKIDTALSSIGGVSEFDIALSGAGGFPDMSRPKVLWLRVGEGASSLEKLALRVEGAAKNADFAPETRKFRAHLTLARVKAGAPLPDKLAEMLQNTPSLSWRCRNFILMKSVLAEGGALHIPLREYPLG